MTVVIIITIIIIAAIINIIILIAVMICTIYPPNPKCIVSILYFALFSKRKPLTHKRFRNNCHPVSVSRCFQRTVNKTVLHRYINNRL
jgi:hypothetical protein